MSKLNGALALAKSLNGDDAGSKILGISHSEDVRLWKKTVENFFTLIRTASNSVKNKIEPDAFQGSIFFISAKTFLSELRAVLFDIHVVSSG